MRQVRGEERLALRLVALLLQLHLERRTVRTLLALLYIERPYLELLLLLLEQVDATKTHHIRSHHVWQHVREAERRHLGMVSTRGCTELRKTLQLRLGLCEVGLVAISCLNCTCSAIYAN